MKCWNGPTMTLLTVIVAWVTVIPMPQLWAQTRGHVLWGDFVIDMSRAPPGSPQTFQLVLTRIPGRVVDRQTVGPRDRYRFHGVSNGEYLLTIEVDHREILSMPLSITGVQAHRYPTPSFPAVVRFERAVGRHLRLNVCPQSG